MVSLSNLEPPVDKLKANDFGRECTILFQAIKTI